MKRWFLCGENSSIVYETWNAERDKTVLVCDRCMCGGKFTEYVIDKEFPKMVDNALKSYAEWEGGIYL